MVVLKMENINFSLTKRQKRFIDATESEVLYGGAAGGGKSYCQLIDAYLYALKYKGSKQIIFRRTFADLEKSLIRVSRDMFRQDLCKYNESKHTYRFINGSIIDFGYIATESDVYQYQSAEYDTIRFDELTHFTEYMYIYMLSRLRGANDYPKQIKSSTNPGNVGHGWVKARFIDICPPETHFDAPTGSRIFIPAKITDNSFLMKADPEYLNRLENLPEEQKKALLYGSWDVYEGQYFREWTRETHTCDPFKIPMDWKHFRSMDWGFNDPCCCLWHAVSPDGRVYTYRELYIRETLARDVADKIRELTARDEKISYMMVSPDMWQTRGQRDIDGENIAEVFMKHGVTVLKADTNRIVGWNLMREYMANAPDGKPRWMIFNTCTNLIRTIPLAIYDQHNVEDVSDKCEDHALEAARYGLMSRPLPNRIKDKPVKKHTYNPLDDSRERRKGGFNF